VTALKPTHLADLVARILWEQKPAGVLDPKEFSPSVGPAIETSVTVLLPGEGMAVIRPEHHLVDVEVERHLTVVERFDAHKIIRTWRALRALGVLHSFGETRSPPEISKAMVTPLQAVIRKIGFAKQMWAGANIDRALDRRLSSEIAAGRYQLEVVALAEGRRRRGYHIAGGHALTIRTKFLLDGERQSAIVREPSGIMFEIPCEQIFAALERVKQHAIAANLLGQQRLDAAVPPIGGARVAEIAKLCRHAVELDPELEDSRGVPIRPLVEQHLPELLRRHAAAAQAAHGNERAEIDSDLNQGVEIIRKATEDALGRLSEKRRDDLREQLRFLEMRHPIDSLFNCGSAPDES